MKNMLKSNLRKAGLIGAALVATAASAMAQPDPATVTTAIDAAEGHATTIGTAGLTLMGIFIGFKLLRRAANRLT